MAKYNVHGGHNRKVPGASGILDEVTEDRKVKNAVIKYLKAQGHTAYDCTDDAGTTQGKNLANIVAKCNSHDGIELDISVHLNAGRDDDEGDGKTGGTEVLIYSTAVKDAAKDQMKLHQKDAQESKSLKACMSSSIQKQKRC